ncbi:type II toxin-antitoxin system VapC family toxin [Microlunatus speluncae]|uniref:type II toxin-antitoxin system VapC family toxin n=1 Tax=Microlunatus speluncae TaxID=2594267 RepID=UPI0012660850|nr:type II toxin-antitoxin system VapC family toxin [Microlunatus speluncae]
MTYLLDTNVVSELRKRFPDDGVARWAKAVHAGVLFLSVITIRELEAGILAKERRDATQGAVLRRWYERKVLSGYRDRILPIDLDIARRSAALHVPDPMPERDALIAATALVSGLTVVTRNVGDFARTGVGLLDPWNG